MANRRFPPPWTVEDIGAAFVVKDSAGAEAGLRLLCGALSDNVPQITGHTHNVTTKQRQIQYNCG